MGSGLFPGTNIQEDQSDKSYHNNIHEVTNLDKNYDIDVIQVSNIALAIKNKQSTINVELSLRCQNLPIMKTFRETDSIIVVYKIEQESMSCQTLNYVTEIGRTDIVKNQCNPKYIKSFIFSFNPQKKQKIQFCIYDILDSSSDNLNLQNYVGRAYADLDYLVQNENSEIQLTVAFKTKKKSIIKAHCIEYDGGNSKYQIGLDISGLQGKIEVFSIIQIFKLNDWIPIARSQPLQIRKKTRFQEMQVPYNRFQGEDNCRIKIKLYQITKIQDQEQIGSTEEITLMNLYTNDEKFQTQRIYKNGFGIGTITIYKWRKVIKDSFISYIVNGAHLNLILGIDFTNSNTQNTKSLHQIQNNTNPYIEAISEIIGVLQYFSYSNQIALYGFGAKLPPFYKSVGHCFALNGDFFNPTVAGGVDKIIKCYKNNLKNNKMHGPTKLSELIDLTIQYAESESQQSNYYVLILMTDGKINDYNNIIQRVILASCLPLSIIIVGVGQNDFQLIQKLNSESKNFQSKTGQKCQRNIIDFIKLNDFRKESGILSLARRTFAEIPSQFIQYMSNKNIKPNREKKSLKAAKAEFISEKIKSIKKHRQQSVRIIIPPFLEYKKKKMKKDLIALGFDADDPLIDNLNIAMDELSYFIEIHSFNKRQKKQIKTNWIEKISWKQQKKLQQYLEKKDLQSKKKTLETLQKIQSNQYGRKIYYKPIQQQKIEKILIEIQNPCLKCHQNSIQYVHLQCGHAGLCNNCLNKKCIICGHKSQLINLKQFSIQS